MKDDILISADRLGKRVSTPDGELTILDDISLAVNRGESCAVVGPSGSGKSTLLGLLAGLDVPSSGSVVLDGQHITALDEDGRAAVRLGRVGFVFQSFQLLPNLTALQNVLLPLELLDRRDAGAVARDWLDRVGLAARAAHYPHQLSGGEQQRVAIARAFVLEPAILFADEPTGNLDTATGQRIADLLLALNRDRGTTLMLVTHDARLAAACDRQLALDGGQLVA